MRHGKKFNHLSRTSSHRKAMLANMASSLIIHKRIKTTLAKAKALRSYIEPLITKSKVDSTHSRRTVFSYLQNKEAVTELFREISQKIAERPGGYTRILKTGTRLGDNAEMCFIELVDYNENLLAEKVEKKVKTTRRRRGSKKKSVEEQVADKPVETTETDVTADETTSEEIKSEESEDEAKAKAEVKEEVGDEVMVEEKKEEIVDEVESEVEEKKEEIVDKAKSKAEEKKEEPAEKKDESPKTDKSKKTKE
ncbi:MAG: 50S ribosomal protein L17 [Bacteroidetes bacterium]|nr:50S ribosomal protein L17 [Bacteroidota bacterium]